MARSLGLAAYRALSVRREAPDFTPCAPRPAGELLWIHTPEPGSLPVAQYLAKLIAEQRGGLIRLITLPKISKTVCPPNTKSTFYQHLPSENPQAVAQFLDHWRPDLCLWCWGDLQPNLILETADRQVPLILVDADSEGVDKRRDRWLPDLTRRVLRKFERVFARSEDALKRFVKVGLPRNRVDLTAPLLAAGRVLPCADSDLSEMAQALAGRPVWFANKVTLEELDAVLEAHRAAMRLSHRLMLIINPSNPGDASKMKDRILAQQFALFLWPDGGYPDASVHVMLAQEPGDAGLFYRVAPVSFLGGSLFERSDVCDPFEAANLGSAILYGPRVGPALASYSRLADHGAARIVKDGQTLGNAVSRLISPDQAAAMAHAGWDVISQGAGDVDQIIDLVQSTLDKDKGTT